MDRFSTHNLSGLPIPQGAHSPANDALYGKQTMPLAALMSTARFAAVTHQTFSYWRKFAEK